MMLEFRHPIPVKTVLGEGYAVYVTNSGALANDVWCVVLDDGRLRHFTTEQLTMVDNGTLGIEAATTPQDNPGVLHFSATRDENKVACQAIAVWPSETTADVERATCVICKRVTEPEPMYHPLRK